jgi:glycosyltransferase involved in cell wall biosynthesis
MRERKHTSMPSVSVIVPAYNSERYVQRCIEGLLEQTYPSSAYEIVMVDNNSTDRSREIIRSYPRIRLILEPKQGSYAARNHGVRVSDGEVLVFTDSDCVPSSCWLVELMKAFVSPEICIVQGARKFARDSATLSMLATYDAERAANTFSPVGVGSQYGYTNNMAVRREVFDRCGPFLEIPRGADSLFVDRVVAAYSHDAVRYAPDASIRHLEITSVWQWLRKRAIYGRSYQLMLGHRESYRGMTLEQGKQIFERTIERGGYSWAEIKLLILLGRMAGICFKCGQSAGRWQATGQRAWKLLRTASRD